MAVNMSEFVPDTNLNWLALAACVYGNITAGRALCCLGLVGTKPKREYKRVSDLDGNSLLKMHQAGMSLRSISAKVGANRKTVKRALMMLGGGVLIEEMENALDRNEKKLQRMHEMEREGALMCAALLMISMVVMISFIVYWLIV